MGPHNSGRRKFLRLPLLCFMFNTRSLRDSPLGGVFIGFDYLTLSGRGVRSVSAERGAYEDCEVARLYCPFFGGSPALEHFGSDLPTLTLAFSPFFRLMRRNAFSSLTGRVTEPYSSRM